jgi:hypothetical protein
MSGSNDKQVIREMSVSVLVTDLKVLLHKQCQKKTNAFRYSNNLSFSTVKIVHEHFCL